MRSAKFTNVLHIAQTPSKKMMGFSATRLPSLSATMASMAFLRAFGSGRLLARLSFRQRSLDLADASGAKCLERLFFRTSRAVAGHRNGRHHGVTNIRSLRS